MDDDTLIGKMMAFRSDHAGTDATTTRSKVWFAIKNTSTKGSADLPSGGFWPTYAVIVQQGAIRPMTPKQKRGFSIVAIAGLLGIALMLVLGALRDNIVFFYSPSEIDSATPRKAIRLGGLVKEGSVTISGLDSVFTVTDGSAEIKIRYANALPSLFREGQGVVAEGRLVNGVLVASNVLAKHDETYMPKEVADSLKKQGVWQGAD